jgi:hypothetical protein
MYENSGRSNFNYHLLLTNNESYWIVLLVKYVVRQAELIDYLLIVIFN